MHDASKPFMRPSNQKDYAIKDLSVLSKAQLLELRDRQQDILKNKSRLSKLPDKGKRIEELYDRIVKQLQQTDEIEQAARLFSDLNISSKGTKFVTNLEWTGDLKSTTETDVQVEVEEETDPLKIIAQAREKQKIIRIEQPEPSLVTEQDLKDIEEVQKLNVSSGSSQLDSHSEFLCAKEELEGNNRKSKFRPYQTTKSNVHDPEKETSKTFKYSEVTAATPPLLKHPGTKMLSLHESLELQISKDKEMKEIQRREAELRLAERTKQLKARDFVAKDISEFFKSYRVVNESSDEGESSGEEEWDSAEEVVDIDAQEERGGVSFAVEQD